MRAAVWAAVGITYSVALTILVTGIIDLVGEDEISRHGIEVPADVIDVSVSSGGDSGPTSTVTVRFKPRGDDLTKTTTEVSYDGDFGAEHPNAERQGTRVEYDPNDPEHARILGETGDALDRVIAGVVFTAVIGGFAVLLWKRSDILGV